MMKCINDMLLECFLAMMYLGINFTNEMNSLGLARVGRCAFWLPLRGETVVAGLESDHFCGLVFQGIYNLIVWDAGLSCLQRSWSIGIGP